MSTHIFDTEIAEKYGIEAAIILQNISFWIEKNAANEKHLHDGKYWTYNSVRAFGEIFKYMSESTIRRNLLKLETEGLVVTGNFNSLSFDRTIWYSITEKGFSVLKISICHSEQTQYSETTHPFSQTEGTIPDIKPDIKPDTKIYICNTFSKPTLEEVKAYCVERKNKVDPEKWMDHYISNGWRVGKSPMKDWHSAVRTWERNNFTNFSGSSYSKPDLKVNQRTTMLDLED